MKKFLPIAMAAVMSMSAVAVSAVSANAVEPLNTPVQYAQVARASLATPKISKAESVYGGVKLTWNKVNGAAKYRVYYKGRKGWTRMVDTTSTSYIDKDVSSGRNYTYTVRCISADGKSFTSGYDSKGTTVKYVAAPEISKLESVNGGVKISWGKVSGATKYRVYYKGRKGWTRMVDTTSTSYIDKDVSSGRNYTYTVRCISKDGKTFTSGYDSKGKSVKYVAAPKISKVESVYDGTKITWNKVTGAEKYRVYYKDRTGWNRLADTTGTSVVDDGLLVSEGSTFENRRVSYTVRCISGDGKKFVSGYDSKGKTAVDGQYHPNITNISTVSNGIKLDFNNALTSNSKYRIYRKENGSWKKLAETYNQYYTDKNVKAGKSYTYTVRCVSKDGKKFTSSFNPSGVTLKYKTTNKTRDDFVNYLMNHQSEWLPSNYDSGLAVAHSGFEFTDLDFDGVLELVVQESGGTMGNYDGRIYSFKNGKLVKAKYSENYIQNRLRIYYNKSSKKYEVFGTAYSSSGTYHDRAFSQFQFKYDGIKVTTDYFAAYYMEGKFGEHTSQMDYTYYKGLKGYYASSDNIKEISKSNYNDILRSRFANRVNAHKRSQFILRVNTDNCWNNMSYSQKKQALLDSYDSFSYDKY